MNDSQNSKNNKRYLIRQISYFFALMVCIFYASRSIYDNINRQILLKQRSAALYKNLETANELNQELKQGLNNYLSPYGMERLARERLNLAAKDEIIVKFAR